MNNLTKLEFGKKKGIRYMNRPGSYAIIFNKEKGLAIVKVNGKNFLPGGAIKKNESSRKALKRELAEELGWNIKIDRNLGKVYDYYFSRSKNKYIRKIENIFEVTFTENNKNKREKDHKLVWIKNKDKIHNFFHPGQAWIVNKYISSRL